MKDKWKILRYGCLAAAIGMIGIGVYLGEPYAVFSQAIRICLECIGIG